MPPERASKATHPLGPVLIRGYAKSRAPAILVALACALVLAIAAWLQPDPAGIGTHRQLGIARCSWPVAWGIPCPTCGMTTAFALTVRGHWLDAFRTQPLGLLLALATAGVGVLATVEAVTRRRRRINWYRVRPRILVVAGVLLAVLAWSYKILVFRGQMG